MTLKQKEINYGGQCLNIFEWWRCIRVTLNPSEFNLIIVHKVINLSVFGRSVGEAPRSSGSHDWDDNDAIEYIR